MTNRETMELFIEKNGQETVAYPFVEKDHVVFGNGMGIEEVIEQDISMPTVTHEEVSFKVGVGDQDVSSSVVDSSVGEMVIKGQTYHNILPEPSTHVLTNNKEMFKVNEGLDPNVEIVDGVAKSAILKGNTLVNLLKPSNNITVDANGTWITNNPEVINESMIKPSTTYTLITYVHNNTIADGGGYVVGVGGGNQQHFLFSGNQVISPNQTGVFKLLMTTKSDTTLRYALQQVMYNTSTQGSITFSQVLLEGDYTTADITYFEGMQSVKMPVLKTTGKNLFDKSKVNYNTTTNANTGIQAGNSNYVTTDYIEVSSNERYVSNNLGVINFYDSSKNFISIINSPTLPKTFITPSNCKYIRVRNYSLLSSLEEQQNAIETLQIEQGTQATSYEPYQTNILTVNEEVELRGIGDVKDTLDLTTGEVVERVGEIVLNGSEQWRLVRTGESTFLFGCDDYIIGTSTKSSHICNIFKVITPDANGGIWDRDEESIAFKHNDTNKIRIRILKSKVSDLISFKSWLSSNPVVVQYKLTEKVHKTVDLSIIDQDGNTPEGLHFFKDGHIQLSSGADNSLIPTLNYQAKTSNSYVMDLMKTNTKYTMKAKSASGTFTIDGTSYGAGTNGTFTTPSSMTNKFLVMNDKTHEEVMILEGDVTSKTIPYFKGIKSAFEDESKIEVLSTNHNLWTGVDNYTNNGATIILKDENECVFEHHAVNNGIRVKVSDYEYQVITMSYDFEILDGKALNVGGHNRHQTKAYYIDGVKVGTNYHNGYVTTYEKNRVYHVDHVVHINLPITEGVNGDREYIGIEPNRYSADTPTYCKMRVTNFQITLGDVVKEYKVPKSNSTKIPLLSPLRSLPNGVCDELIIDRMKKKATLIQRVGHSVINSEFAKNGGKWGNTKDTDPCWGFHCGNYVQGSFKLNEHNSINDKLPIKPMVTTGDPLMGYYQSNPHIALRREEVCDMKMALNWLDRNPIDFYYQLETPIITEVDLEGFPYIYKDGHIFLNSEIAPTTQITYSISQQHQISASTQDLIRHEQELVYLYKLIAQYIQVDYQSTLLSLDLKLK